MLCGNEVVPWKNLVNCSTMNSKIINRQITRPHFISPGSTSWLLLCTRRYLSWSTPRLVETLRENQLLDLELVFFTNFHHASDPRDMIYALLGMLRLDLTPDYSTSVRELYCHFAGLLVNSESGLKLLGRSGVGRGWTDESNLPSWVPDWHGNSLITS